MTVPQVEVRAFDGTRIPCDRQVPVAQNAIAQALVATARWKLVPLLPPSAVYNCFGLVFASRRTNLLTAQAKADHSEPAGLILDQYAAPLNARYDDWTCEDLFRHDLYHQVVHAKAAVGDVVAYRTLGSGRVDHVGFVVQADTAGEVLVWSKWGPLGEYCHLLADCPFADGCVMEYWRAKR
jgi:hypothetical protein